MNSYELSRHFFDWCFDNASKVRPAHCALYFFIIEHNNRLGWKKEFGLPRKMAMDAIGIKNDKTYSATFNDLEKWKFIRVLERSKNQYSANIITLNANVKNTPAPTSALSKAMLKHSRKHVAGIVAIDKPLNQLNHKQGTDARASEILKTKKQMQFDDYKMQNRKQIPDWENLIDSFDDTIELEISQGKIEMVPEQLMPRFRKYARSWMSNRKNGTRIEQAQSDPYVSTAPKRF